MIVELLYVGLGASAILLPIVLAPELRRLLDGRWATPPKASPAPGPLRAASVSLVAAALVVPMTYDMAKETEHWPSSNYPMFSTIRPRERQMDFLFGVAEDGREINLHTNDSYLYPFIRANMSSLVRKGEAQDGLRRREVLTDLIDRYEGRRIQGMHDGPPLRAIRLYREDWRIDTKAADGVLRTGRTLLAEIEKETP